MKTKLTEGWRTWIKHCLFAVVLTIYFVSDYIVAGQIIQTLLNSNAAFDYTCKRVEYSLYVGYLTEETLFDTVDIRYMVQQRISELYDNERKIKMGGSLLDPLISQF